MQTLFRSYNLSVEESLEHVKRVLEANGQFYGGIRIRGVAVNNNGQWRNVLCVVMAFPQQEVPIKESSREYREMQLREEWLDLRVLPQYLESLAKNGLMLSSLPINRAEDCRFREVELLPSNNDYSPNPGYLYLSGRNDCTLSNDPLVTYDLPVHSDPDHAIQEWCQLKTFNRSGDGRLGAVLLFLPECRAFFERFEYSEEKLAISVKAVDPLRARLKIKGIWRRAGHWNSFESSPGKGTMEIDLPIGADLVEAYLMGPENELFDFHRETSFRSIGQDRVLSPLRKSTAKEESILNYLRLGEGETVEYKPFIKPGDPKQNELVETAIAFSNTKGGVILLGIDDHCAVQGIEKELFKTRIKNSPWTIQDYIGHIRQLISGATKRTIGMDFDSVKVDGHTVLSIRVEEGSEKPYSNVRTKAIYIRHGANNVFPDPDTELPQLKASGDGIMRSVSIQGQPVRLKMNPS